jgi:nucleoside-diphosphate-sugar epimerase
MTAVAVTGAAGPVGRRLVDRLCDDSDVTRVVVIDRRPLRRRHDKVVAHSVQLRGADIAGILDGVDTVIHLAGSDPLEGTAVDHDLLTTSRLLDGVHRSGAGHLVVRSSATTHSRCCS